MSTSLRRSTRHRGKGAATDEADETSDVEMQTEENGVEPESGQEHDNAEATTADEDNDDDAYQEKKSAPTRTRSSSRGKATATASTTASKKGKAKVAAKSQSTKRRRSSKASEAAASDEEMNGVDEHDDEEKSAAAAAAGSDTDNAADGDEEMTDTLYADASTTSSKAGGKKKGTAQRKKRSPNAGGGKKRQKKGSAASTDETGEGGDDESAEDVKSEKMREDDQQMGDLYKSMILTNSASKVIVRDLLDQYDADATQDEAIARLTSFLVQIAGSKVKFNDADIANEREVSVLVRRAEEDVRERMQGGDASKRQKRIETRMRDFFFKLVESGSRGQIFDDTLCHIIGRWLSAISSSQMRVFRQWGTQLMVDYVDALTALAYKLHERLHTARTQLAASNTKSETKQQLRGDIEVNTTRIKVIQQHIKQVFEGVFVHRYRDIDPKIRKMAISGLGHWIQVYPQMFLQDTFLKYLGWCLNDKAVEVRKAALMSIVSIYDTANTDTMKKMETFTARFMRRFNEMTNDYDASVAAMAVECMTKLLKLGELKETEGDNVPALLWDKDPNLRVTAADFVYADTFEDSQTENPTLSQLHDDITQLLNIFDRYCPLVYKEGNSATVSLHALSETTNNVIDLQMPVQTMVIHMAPKLSALSNLEAITSMVLAAETTSSTANKRRQLSAVISDVGKLDEDRQLLILHLLLACVTTIFAQSATKAGRFGREAQTDEDIQSMQETANTHLMETVPKLISQYSTDAIKLRVVLQLLPFIQIESYATMRKKTDLKELLKQLKAVHSKHSDVHVLGHVATALKRLCKADYSYVEEALNSTTDLVKDLLASFNKLVGSADATMNGETEKETELLAILRRMAALARPIEFEELRYEKLNADELTQQYVDDHEAAERQQLLVVLLDLQYSSLQWQWYRAAGSELVASVEADALQSLSTALNAFLTRLTHLLTDSTHYVVTDMVYRYLSDTFVLFNGKSPVSISKRQLQDVQPEFNKYFQSLMSGRNIQQRLADLRRTNERTDRSDVLATMRLMAVRGAMAPVLNDVQPESRTSRHRPLAAQLIAQYNKWGSEIDELIKHTMNLMKKNLGVRELLTAQLGALEYLYSAQANEKDIAALSSKLVQQLAFAKDIPFVEVLREGIVYALRDLPSNLSFLQFIEPFLQRATAPQIKQISVFFTTQASVAYQQAKNEGWSDDWKPLKQFTETIKKTLNKKQSSSSSAADAIPPTPSSAGAATPSARTPQSASSLASPAITSGLTPAAPSTAQAEQRKRLQSIQESNVEEDEHERALLSEDDDFSTSSRSNSAAARKSQRSLTQQLTDDAAESGADEIENIRPARTTSATYGKAAAAKRRANAQRATIDEEETQDEEAVTSD